MTSADKAVTLAEQLHGNCKQILDAIDHKKQKLTSYNSIWYAVEHISKIANEVAALESHSDLKDVVEEVEPRIARLEADSKVFADNGQMRDLRANLSHIAGMKEVLAILKSATKKEGEA